MVAVDSVAAVVDTTIVDRAMASMAAVSIATPEVAPQVSVVVAASLLITAVPLTELTLVRAMTAPTTTTRVDKEADMAVTTEVLTMMALVSLDRILTKATTRVLAMSAMAVDVAAEVATETLVIVAARTVHEVVMADMAVATKDRATETKVAMTMVVTAAITADTAVVEMIVDLTLTATKGAALVVDMVATVVIIKVVIRVVSKVVIKVAIKVITT